MKCDICRRALSADEPIWHFRPGHTRWRDLTDFRNEGVACERCKAKPPKGAEHMFSEEAWQRPWGAPRPCAHCRRPIFNRQPTKGAALMCGPECRQAARYARLRIVRPTRACAQCQKPFVPRRDDARFCSVACKQRAYRRRASRHVVRAVR
jgi:hypothetical protein